ncbi:hypothetical protein [Pyxidicoccus caerfyrddinensis]|uniref:hypothetical protein n=1 Tax=Pyxidicoccus caerfyrddinensis TaxID=2709663 RepID=UPI0013D943ED|nr:hypothetical protein [Pyxidicoccus caerfyrddinensis]
MRRFSLRDALFLAPAALMSMACGGVSPEDLDSAPAEDSALGTSQAGLSVTLSCNRTSTSFIYCLTTATGGVAPYTYYWGMDGYDYTTGSVYTTLMAPGARLQKFSCTEPGPGAPAVRVIVPLLQVVDATMTVSPLHQSPIDFYCAN